MNSNTLSKLFAVTNFGESHGPAIGCVIDGCPPGLNLSEQDIQPELDRRRPGTSRFVTQRKETDQVQILSGVYQGVTTGTPICLLIPNSDQRSADYGDIATSFRPGHADYSYWHKYAIRDPRGGGRSSARLTAPMVAAGAVAKKWLLQHYGVSIRACVTQIGTELIEFEDWQYANNNPLFAPVANTEKYENYLDAIRKAGDSCGAKLWLQAQQVPRGLGAPLFHKLDGDIAQVMMGLNAVKAVEIGAGTAVVAQLGSEHGDDIYPDGFASNNAGGILGGISSGQDINVYLSIKPTSSILIHKNSINTKGEAVSLQTKGRHDPCVGLRAAPIVEALLALVLIEHCLYLRAQCADVALQQQLATLNNN